MKVLQFPRIVTNKRKIIGSNYTIHDKKLKLVDSAKYLGVTLSKNLSWKHHIGIITAKANSTRLFLQRNLVKVDKETKLKCYHVFTRPILEYASTVWNPVNQVTLISRLEMVQNKSIRWICSNWRKDVSVTKLRSSLQMKTLETRRSIAQLKMFHDLIYSSKCVQKDILPKRHKSLNQSMDVSSPTLYHFSHIWSKSGTVYQKILGT